MINPDRIKKQIIKAINANPTSISINQVRKIEVDGYFKKDDIVKDLKVLIYPYKNTETQIASNTIGTSYSSKKYSMIADYAADLRVNSKESIKFDCKEGHMELIGVYPIVIKEIICGYECDLKRNE